MAAHSTTTTYFNLKREFYKEHPRVELRTWNDIDRFLNLHQIKFSGFDFPKPIFSLDEINFPNYIINELKLQGVGRPTAIPAMTWPALYSGRDLMCIGLPIVSRVVSYLCPALVFIREQPIETRKAGALVLIVTQTKEVAREIFTHAQMFIHQAQCTFCCLFDDENINTQSMILRENDYDIIIGNYHRLCELLDMELLNLKNVSYLIMDDFYRNRSARLSDEVKRVVNETRSDRQTVIFSRIVPSGLQKSNGDEFQNDALFVCVGNDDIYVPNRDLPQIIHVCTMAEKRKKIQDLITEIAQQDKNFKILVYANGFKKIRITERIVKELRIDTFAYERTPAGKRRRAMKEKVYYNFNATPNSVLVASDVVSSKVELHDLNYVINADFPANLSLYLNRMKMQSVKKYISIFIAEDARHADRLIHVLHECHQPVPPILFKISQAYIQSGKDVDRMPSLQEINDGITKPVEKPIPKPIPPTVSLDSDGSGQKRSIEEILKSQIRNSTQNMLNSQQQAISDAVSESKSNETQLSFLSSSSSSLASPSSTSISSSIGGTSRFHHPNKRFRPGYHHNHHHHHNNRHHNNSYQQQQQQSYPSNSSNLVYNQPRPPNQMRFAMPVYSMPPPPMSIPGGPPVYAYHTVPANTNQAVYPTTSYQYSPYNPTPNIIYPTTSANEIRVKSEPVELVQSHQQQPYFTNPIPFKQEADIKQEPGVTKQEDAAALNIVNHLLKDQNIMSQLEKVAQTLRRN